MNSYLNEIPPLFIQLLLTTFFSFLLGLEQRKHYPQEKEQLTFGTARTFTFIGLLGFVLLIADSSTQGLYPGGGLILGLLLGVFYYFKIKVQNHFGLTTILLALLTYVIPLLVITQPHWLTMVIFIVVLLLVEAKENIGTFSQKVDRNEFLTLAKFILIAGVILPIVPDRQIFSFLNLSPYKVWLAIVVISGISYLSYLLRKFVFPQAGLLLTGVLGGLYSSTATTIILARKSKEAVGAYRQYAAAIIVATAMMFLRIYILLFIFNRTVGVKTASWFALLFLLTLGVAYFLYRGSRVEPPPSLKTDNFLEDKNPLEFKVAIVFALLYIFFSIITQYTLQHFGNQGLKILSFVVGFTDIDPFLLNLFQGKYNVTPLLIGLATFQAIASNNVLKLGYGIGLGNRQMRKYLILGFGVIIMANFVVIALMHMIG